MCTKSRNSDVCFQRKFVAFIRALRLLMQVPSDVPAALDITELLSVRNCELCALDEEKVRALFEHYFLFDIS